MNKRFLQLSASHVTGVEISDTLLRFMTLRQHDDSVLPEAYAEVATPSGCMENGIVINKQKLVSFLRTIRKTHKIEQVRLVLTSSQIQTMSVSVSGAAPLYIKEAVEKQFALPSKDILYEYHAIGGDTTTSAFQYTAVPKTVAEEFLNCFKSAGIIVLSIESASHALSRAILPLQAQSTTMVVSIDTTITTVALVVNGAISQATMFAFGDTEFIQAIAKARHVHENDADKIKQEEGLIVDSSRIVFDAIVDDCAALVHHINDLYITWRTTHKTLPALENIYLTGPGSMVFGLDEYIAAGMRTSVQQANVWMNCLSFDEYIPALSRAEAIRYGTVIGAALINDDHAISLLPIGHKKSLRRRHALSVTTKILLSFVFGVVVGYIVARIVAVPTVHTQILTMLHKIQAQW